MIKQSLSWWAFCRQGVTPEILVREAKRVGYAGFDLVPEEHWGRIIDAGMTVACVSGHQSLADGLNRRENHDRIAGEIEQNLIKAVQNGIPKLVVFSGNRAGSEDGAEATAEVLRRVVPLAEETGVTLILELLNSKKDHRGYEADHTDWGAAVCRQVDSRRVKLLYDIYHMQIMEGMLSRRSGRIMTRSRIIIRPGFPAAGIWIRTRSCFIRPLCAPSPRPASTGLWGMSSCPGARRSRLWRKRSASALSKRCSQRRAKEFTVYA